MIILGILVIPPFIALFGLGIIIGIYAIIVLILILLNKIKQKVKLPWQDHGASNGSLICIREV